MELRGDRVVHVERHLMQRVRQILGGHAAWSIGAVWVALTLLNLAKPFHIDDTAHVLIAEHIVRSPFNPMSGMLNWTQISEPIFKTNQPHFFFYIMAGVIALFGTSALALHLLIAPFTLAVLVLSYRLGQILAPGHGLVIALAIGLSPGFVINQNVMVEMPLLAMMLLAVWALTTQPARPILGFVALSAALLTKYVALFLLPAVIWGAAIRGRAVVWAIVPILALVAWSWFNIMDFGQAHILARPTSSERGWFPSELLALALIGASGGFALPIFAALLADKNWKVWTTIAALAAITWFAVWMQVDPGRGLGWIAVNALLVGPAVAMWCAAAAGGVSVLVDGFRALLAGKALVWLRDNQAITTVGAWMVGGTLFLIIFAPFMATRHVMLIILPIAIFALRGRDVLALRSRLAVAFFVPWAALSAYVAMNDRDFAQFYASQATLASARAAQLAPDEATVLTVGHWGWQYYAVEAGMTFFDGAQSVVQPGDILVMPLYVDKQTVPHMDRFDTLEEITQPLGFWNTIDTRTLYDAGARALPVLAPSPRHRIVILQRGGADG